MIVVTDLLNAKLFKFGQLKLIITYFKLNTFLTSL